MVEGWGFRFSVPGSRFTVRGERFAVSGLPFGTVLGSRLAIRKWLAVG